MVFSQEIRRLERHGCTEYNKSHLISGSRQHHLAGFFRNGHGPTETIRMYFFIVTSDQKKLIFS